MICNECKTEDSKHWFRKGEHWFCKEHAGAGNIVRIIDANGKVRDREWLQKKVDMTRHEKTWHEDIKSRKVMPDGSVQRVR